jgi:hypothetical protein
MMNRHLSCLLLVFRVADVSAFASTEMFSSHRSVLLRSSDDSTEVLSDLV